MNRRNLLCLFLSTVFAFATLSINVQAQTSLALSDGDLAQVVAAIVSAKTDTKNSAYPTGGMIYLSDRNLRDQWVVNPIAGKTVRLLTPEEIETQFVGDFTYYTIGRLSRTANGIKATITHNWRDPDDRKRFSETTYWIERIDGVWTVTAVEAFIEIACGPNEFGRR